MKVCAVCSLTIYLEEYRDRRVTEIFIKGFAICISIINLMTFER